MAFNLGSFQTFGERLGRIEALKKAWEIANVSPLDIPGVRGAVKKALPKPLEGPAQFALGQFNPLNAGLIAAGIVVPPLGVMGAAGRTASIGARIAPELRVAGTSLLGAYGGQQAGQLAERELGIPGAGLVGSLAGGFGGAAYGIKGLPKPPVAELGEVPHRFTPRETYGEAIRPVKFTNPLLRKIQGLEYPRPTQEQLDILKTEGDLKLIGLTKEQVYGPPGLSELTSAVFSGDVAYLRERFPDLKFTAQDLVKSQTELRAQAQRSLTHRGLPSEFIVFRGGDPLGDFPTPVTLDSGIARSFAGSRGGAYMFDSLPGEGFQGMLEQRPGAGLPRQVNAFLVRRDDVLADINSIRPREKFGGEQELLVFGKDLTPVSPEIQAKMQAQWDILRQVKATSEPLDIKPGSIESLRGTGFILPDGTAIRTTGYDIAKARGMKWNPRYIGLDPHLQMFSYETGAIQVSWFPKERELPHGIYILSSGPVHGEAVAAVKRWISAVLPHIGKGRLNIGLTRNGNKIWPKTIDDLNREIDSLVGRSLDDLSALGPGTFEFPGPPPDDWTITEPTEVDLPEMAVPEASVYDNIIPPHIQPVVSSMDAEIAKRVTYGMREETVKAANAWIASWSNAKARWSVWRWKPMKKGQAISLDANEILVYGKLKDLNEATKWAIPLPLYRASFEAKGRGIYDPETHVLGVLGRKETPPGLGPGTFDPESVTPSSELFKARGLRDEALARAKALGFDPRSPRKPGETPEMAALRDEFHRLNKQVGDIQRGMSDRPVADLPPEFKIGGAAEPDAAALIAEGDALMAEGRQALAAEKYRQALGMVTGGGQPPIKPPIIEGPGTFGEGFELGPGGGPPPGGRQPSLGGELTPPPLKYEFDLGAELSALANLPRILLVSVLDFSGTMRQLFPAWAGKPSLLPKLLARQWGSMWNEEASTAFRARLATNRNVQRLQQEGGLHIAVDAATAEEPYLLATKDTWIHRMIEKFTPVRITERAYTDATNMARQELVDKYYAPWPESWKADPVKSKRMGSLINELAGRGDIKALSKLAPWMNTVLFSPRLMWSRLKLPLRVVDLRHPEMRQILARHLAGTYGSMVAMAGILTMAGVTVELDPRSSNFMKARIGNTRVDMTAGFGPIWRYMAMMATGERKTEAGDIVSAPLGETAWRLLRSKMSPTAGLVTDIIGGETFEGRELTLSRASIGEQAKNSLMPLLWQDTADAMKEEGLIVGTGAAVGSFLGVSVQTYPETPQAKLKARFQEKFGKEYEAGVDNVLVEADPELSALAEESQRYKLERGGEGAIAKEKRTREFAQKEQDFNLPMLAEGVLSGDPAAGSQFVEQFERYQQNIADVIYHEFFEDELDVGPTTLARDFDTWRKVTPEQYRDPTTFEIDWETYFKTKDAAFARLPQEYRNAIEVRTRSQDPTVKQVETKFKQARTLRRQYFNLPKWVPQVGSSADQDQIQEIQEAAQVVNQQLASQGYTDVDMKTVYGLVVKTGQYDQRLVGLAFALRSGTKESKLYANPARQEFLLKHVSLLQLFYPAMYRNEQLLAQIGAQDGRNAAFAP